MGDWGVAVVVDAAVVPTGLAMPIKKRRPPPGGTAPSTGSTVVDGLPWVTSS